MSHVSIIPDSQVICVNGRAKRIPDYRWSPRYDLIHAVQYDSDRGQGHVEFKSVATDSPHDADLKPDNKLIGSDEYQEHFSDAVAAFEAQPDVLPDPSPSEAREQSTESHVVSAEFEALKQEVAGLRKIISDLVKAASSVAGGA